MPHKNRSKIGDSGDINNPDGDNRQILAYVSDMVGATSGTLIFETRALGGSNGAALNGVSFDINSTENTSAITSTSFDFTLSSAPRMDLVVHNFGTIGLRPNRTNTEDGMVAYAGIYVRGTDLTRTGADAIKGSGDITSNFTFQFDASLLSSNAEIYDWGVTTGGATIRDANDGVSRNREIYVDDSGAILIRRIRVCLRDALLRRRVFLMPKNSGLIVAIGRCSHWSVRSILSL